MLEIGCEELVHFVHGFGFGACLLVILGFGVFCSLFQLLEADLLRVFLLFGLEGFWDLDVAEEFIVGVDILGEALGWLGLGSLST